MATAGTAEAAVVALQALEGGVQGVLLDTQDALQVGVTERCLCSSHNQGRAQRCTMSRIGGHLPGRSGMHLRMCWERGARGMNGGGGGGVI